MADNKKVLTGLDCLITNKVECKGCPYNVENAYCITSIAQEAKDTIKKQESEILEFIGGVARLTVENEMLKKDNLAKSVLHEHQVNDYLRKQLANRPEIVRCRDCKHHGKDTCSAGAGIAYPPPDDWYCADGERKEP